MLLLSKCNCRSDVGSYCTVDKAVALMVIDVLCVHGRVRLSLMLRVKNGEESRHGARLFTANARFN
jgi:hypothetical protein